MEDGGGGAGAGIGGNGGAGGQANLAFGLDGFNNSFDVSARDGEAGENCGSVTIHDSLIVYAYGGARW